VLFDEKTEGRKSRDTVPLIACQLFLFPFLYERNTKCVYRNYCVSKMLQTVQQNIRVKLSCDCDLKYKRKNREGYYQIRSITLVEGWEGSHR
jgi:hypothetical protein